MIPIPKVFHRVWLGGAPIPDRFQQYWASWERHHPGWTMKTWDESNLPKLEAAENYAACRNHSERSDFIRHQLLATYGGVYVDTDFECFRCIEPLLHDVEAFVGDEGAGVMGTAILRAVPGHPFFAQIVKSFTGEWENTSHSAWSCGPGFIGRIAAKYQLQNSVRIFDTKIFYPVHYTSYHNDWTGNPGDYPEAYGIHHWSGSWVNGKAESADPVKETTRAFKTVECPWSSVVPTHIPVAMGSENVGDDIQSEAASRLWNCRQYVDRDAPSTWPKGALVPLCGWFGRGDFPANSQAVVVGYHCQIAHRQKIREPKIRDWLAAMVKYQGFPAMCRDTATRDLLRGMGIDAEFGGCVSLTLPRSTEKRHPNLRITVDAPARTGYHQISHEKHYLHHLSPETRLSIASANLELFAKAAHVVTRRLHVFLPCIALGTNVDLLSELVGHEIDRISDYCPTSGD